MNIDINLKSKKHFFKKVIILFLFGIICFFIKENVFALSVPDYLAQFTDYKIICEGTENSMSSVCPDTQNHNFAPFVEFFIMPTHKYSLVSNYEVTNGGDYHFYFFSLNPYFYKAYSSSYDVYNIYDTPQKNNFLTYIKMSCDSETKECKSVQYTQSHWNFNPPSDVNYVNSFFYNNDFDNILHSNFNILDTNENIIFNSTSSGTIDWTDTEDIPRPDNRVWYEKLFDNVVGGFAKIGSFMVGVGDKISDFNNSLINFIKDIFVPKEDLLEGVFEDEYDFLHEKLGFLLYPLDILIDFANRVYNISNSQSAVFNIPKVDFMGVTLITATSFDLLSIVNQSQPISYFYSIYRIAVSGFIVIWLIHLAYKKFKETVGGLN